MINDIPKQERNDVDSGDILKVFRDLGIEDPERREDFKKLADLSEWRGWPDGSREPQDTQGNTSVR